MIYNPVLKMAHQASTVSKESVLISKSPRNDSHEEETKLLDQSRNEDEITIVGVASSAQDVEEEKEEGSEVVLEVEEEVEEEESGREKLKRHMVDVAGRVWIPDIWGQEEFLKDWVDCTSFDDTLFPNGIMSARSALVEEGRRGASSRLRSIENRC